MIPALVVERMPEASAHMLAGSPEQSLITGVLIIGRSIMVRLHQHRCFSPGPAHPARRIMRIPIVHVISPFPGKISDIRLHLLGGERPASTRQGMGKQYFKMLVSLGRGIAATITIRIRIFFFHDIPGSFGKIGRIPCFVQDRFPHPYGRMVPVTAYHIPDIGIHPLGKDRGIVPELPARCIDNHKKPQLVASIHKSRILRVVCIPDHL